MHIHIYISFRLVLVYHDYEEMHAILCIRQPPPTVWAPVDWFSSFANK
jgi:hypothetical protein